jgi:hypothetical protein
MIVPAGQMTARDGTLRTCQNVPYAPHERECLRYTYTRRNDDMTLHCAYTRRTHAQMHMLHPCTHMMQS